MSNNVNNVNHHIDADFATNFTSIGVCWKSAEKLIVKYIPPIMIKFIADINPYSPIIGATLRVRNVTTRFALTNNNLSITSIITIKNALDASHIYSISSVLYVGTSIAFTGNIVDHTVNDKISIKQNTPSAIVIRSSDILRIILILGFDITWYNLQFFNTNAPNVNVNIKLPTHTCIIHIVKDIGCNNGNNTDKFNNINPNVKKPSIKGWDNFITFSFLFLYDIKNPILLIINPVILNINVVIIDHSGYVIFIFIYFF